MKESGVKKFLFLVCVLSLMSSSALALTENERQAALEKAREDYRVYLQKLKELSSQYKEVTGEIKKVAKEEGIPVWDESAGEIQIKKGDSLFETVTPLKDVSIQETEKEIFVKADLPGVKKESIKVSIENNKILRIRGEQDSASGRGPIDRSVELPGPVQDTHTDARYENGVLSVKVLKSQESKKEVPVHVN